MHQAIHGRPRRGNAARSHHHPDPTEALDLIGEALAIVHVQAEASGDRELRLARALLMAAGERVRRGGA